MNKQVLLNSKIVVVLAMSFMASSAVGQQLPSLDNYLFTPVMISPAHAGSQSQQVLSMVDAQWAGVPGAPRTGIISLDHHDLGGFAWNITAMNDAVGPASTGYLALSSAYHLPINDVLRLSTGLRVAASQTSIRLDDETFYDELDPDIYNQQGPWRPNVDIGITLESDIFYAGFSYKNANRPQMYNNNFMAPIVQFFGGYQRELASAWTVKANFIASATTNSPADLDFYSFVVSPSGLGFGVHYSPEDDMGVLLKVNISDSWNIFYQYSMPLTELANLSRTSNVVGFAFDIYTETKTLSSPRNF